MNKLTLEHVLSYLPYQLMFLTPKHRFDYGKQESLLMIGLSNELDKLTLKKEMFTNSLNELIDEKGNLRNREISGEDAFIYGATENIKERFSERFVGQAVDNFIPALGSALNKTRIGKTLNKIDDVTTKKLRNGREYLDKALFSNGLGKVSKSLVNQVGPAKVMHSLPGEMIEEIAVQMTPTYQEDYHKQLEELKNPDFYLMIGAQTLLLNSAFSTVGGVSHYYNMAKNEDYRNQYRANQDNKKIIKETYRNLDNAITDDQVAQDIAMSTLGSIFQINDYNGRIAELRNPDAKHNDGFN